MMSEELAKRFKELRKDKGLTQVQLVECMNYVVSRLNPQTELKQRISKKNKEVFISDDRTIRKYENAESRITEEVAEVMALLFRINPRYLLDENAPKKWTKDSLRKDIDELQIKLIESASEFSLMIEAIKALATLNGYDVELNAIKSISEYNSLSEYFKNRKNYLVLKKDNKIIHTLSDSDVILIGNKLDKYFSKKLSEIEQIKSCRE